MANKMDFKERATSIMKKKEEMNNIFMKNRSTIKPQLVEDRKEEDEEENKVYEEKKTIPFDTQPNKRISPEDDMEEREYSLYEDPSLVNSPKSMQSVISINERRHMNFNIKKMIDLIEGCCTNPLKQVEYIVELFKGVDFILNHEPLWEEIFKCDQTNEKSILRLVSQTFPLLLSILKVV